MLYKYLPRISRAFICKLFKTPVYELFDLAALWLDLPTYFITDNLTKTVCLTWKMIATNHNYNDILMKCDSFNDILNKNKISNCCHLCTGLFFILKNKTLANEKRVEII